MNTTQVPTEWLIKLEELIDKVSAIYCESSTDNYNLGALKHHFGVLKYFQPQHDSVDLEGVNAEEFMNWLSDSDKYNYDKDRKFVRINELGRVQCEYPEVLEAFKKSKEK